MRGGVQEKNTADKQGLISVIIPIYQVESELPRCLDSLLAQTYSNFELLLIDDGSPDGCFRVMEGYARKDGVSVFFIRKTAAFLLLETWGWNRRKESMSASSIRMIGSRCAIWNGCMMQSYRAVYPWLAVFIKRLSG